MKIENKVGWGDYIEIEKRNNDIQFTIKDCFNKSASILLSPIEVTELKEGLRKILWEIDKEYENSIL